jgi:signal transduction histidine kinase
LTADDASPPKESDLGAAHTRFARAVMSMYLATAAVAVALLGSTLYTDLTHESESASETLSLETQVRAHYLSRHLQLLAEELTRLGLRSEVDLLDQNMEPERSLLRLSHEKSTFFNVGVAILGADGAWLWSEPQTFRGVGAAELLLKRLKDTHAIQIVPGHGQDGEASILYVASPILRNGQFTGALLGAIDLVSGGALEARDGKGYRVLVALSTREGKLVYPPGPEPFAADPAWQELIGHPQPFVEEASLAGKTTVVAGARVQGTEFILLSLATARDLFGPARSRLATRLVLGLTLAVLPILVLVVLLRRSLRTFRHAEEDAVRNERLRALGEAVDVIAHEVKNSLNNLRVGLDLILRRERPGAETGHGPAAAGLRTEIERLSNFTTELLSFSKGLVPRPVALDLAEFVKKISDLSRSTAESRGVRLEICPPNGPVRVKADPALVHVAVASLLGNALDFVGDGAVAAPCVLVEVGAHQTEAGVRVADNGPGVSDSVKRRLFEPFVSGKPNGVGIGLALSRKIARAHGGDLVLEGSARGAVFYFTLPLDKG